MSKIPNPQLGRSASLGVNAFLRLNPDSTREWVDETTIAGGGGSGGLGDVVGPSSAVDGNLAVFDGTSGKLIKDGGPVPSGGGGSAWFTFTDPNLETWAWVNQGDATEATTDERISITRAVTTGSGESLRILKKAAPSTPYVITAALFAQFGGTTNQGAGLLFRESSSGKIVGFCLHTRSLNALQIFCWTNPTTYGGSNPLNDEVAHIGFPIWLRIADDGTNRIYSYSVDGVNFAERYREARTTFLTADEVGFFINPTNLGIHCSLTIMSWKET